MGVSATCVFSFFQGGGGGAQTYDLCMVKTQGQSGDGFTQEQNQNLRWHFLSFA